MSTSLFLLFIVYYSFQSFLAPTSIPYEGTISDLDVEDTVEVYFDDYGVPSVFASNDSDMFKAAGYIGARDRLFQMSFMKYAYKGQLSLVLNDSLFAEDTFLRTLGFESNSSISPPPPDKRGGVANNIGKTRLIDKSPKKVKFLKKISKELNLNVDVVSANIFAEIDKARGDVIVARAFKPLKIILELIHKIDESWKKTFVFLGKSGHEELHHASKIWDLKYKQRVSVTSNDSIVIEVNKLNRK